ncbi:MAG: LCCL domain-containing protein [Gemmatimonadales bacterium]
MFMYSSELRLSAVALGVVVLGACQNPMDGDEPPPPPPPTITWETNLESERGHIGKQLSFTCPPGGPVTENVWGTIAYTDDSWVCPAALHAGKITAAQGGVITVTIRPGYGNYVGTSRNGATSFGWGAFPGSFSFDSVAATPISGDAHLFAARSLTDSVFVLACSPNVSISTLVWGTDTYTADSSVCTAAIHHGAITRASGGIVFAVIRPGRTSYLGTTRNGVTTRSYPSYGGSFAFE